VAEVLDRLARAMKHQVTPRGAGVPTALDDGAPRFRHRQDTRLLGLVELGPANYRAWVPVDVGPPQGQHLLPAPAHQVGAPRHAINWSLLTVACPGGVVFERWVTPEDAELDLLHLARLN
jgi:hypothetical protein